MPRKFIRPGVNRFWLTDSEGGRWPWAWVNDWGVPYSFNGEYSYATEGEALRAATLAGMLIDADTDPQIVS